MLTGINASLPRLRRRYEEDWNEPWPHDDTYLRELTRDANTLRQVLEMMRECHKRTAS